MRFNKFIYLIGLFCVSFSIQAQIQETVAQPVLTLYLQENTLPLVRFTPDGSEVQVFYENDLGYAWKNIQLDGTIRIQDSIDFPIKEYLAPEVFSTNTFGNLLLFHEGTGVIYPSTKMTAFKFNINGEKPIKIQRKIFNGIFNYTGAIQDEHKLVLAGYQIYRPINVFRVLKFVLPLVVLATPATFGLAGYSFGTGAFIAAGTFGIIPWGLKYKPAILTIQNEKGIIEQPLKTVYSKWKFRSKYIQDITNYGSDSIYTAILNPRKWFDFKTKGLMDIEIRNAQLSLVDTKTIKSPLSKRNAETIPISFSFGQTPNISNNLSQVSFNPIELISRGGIFRRSQKNKQGKVEFSQYTGTLNPKKGTIAFKPIKGSDEAMSGRNRSRFRRIATQGGSNSTTAIESQIQVSKAYISDSHRGDFAGMQWKFSTFHEVEYAGNKYFGNLILDSKAGVSRDYQYGDVIMQIEVPGIQPQWDTIEAVANYNYSSVRSLAPLKVALPVVNDEGVFLYTISGNGTLSRRFWEGNKFQEPEVIANYSDPIETASRNFYYLERNPKDGVIYVLHFKFEKINSNLKLNSKANSTYFRLYKVENNLDF